MTQCPTMEFIEIKLRNIRCNLNDSQWLFWRKRATNSDPSFHPFSITLQTPSKMEEVSTMQWRSVIKRMKPKKTSPLSNWPWRKLTLATVSGL